MTMKRLHPVAVLAAALLAQAAAADPLRVGVSAPNAFDAVPLYVGSDAGLFKKHGVEVAVVDTAGDAKMHQAMTAGSIDLGFGGGQGLAFIAKGAPELAVAAVVGPPLNLWFIVPYDSPVKSLDDLKGRTVGVSTAGSLTYWLTEELNRAKGWSAGGAKPVELGGASAARLAAMKAGQIDATFASVGFAAELQEKKEGRPVGAAAEYVTAFVSEAVYASRKLIASDPQAVRGFLAGMLDAVDYMSRHKAETIAVARKVTGFGEAAEEREYATLMPMFSRDGRLEPGPLAVIETSIVELHMLDAKPDMAQLYSNAFLPR
jgi:ABC-type nitrate/sulfonate/bicarbonate transport system substrate-binding protein